MRHVDKIIVCDDGSTDMTGEIAEKLGAEVIKHERNLGYGAALTSLFERAREEKADVMITIDADGQHNPDDIPNLIEPIISGITDIAIGSRFINRGKERIPKYRKIGIGIITKMTNAAAHGKITDAQSGLRAYNKKALEMIKPCEMGMGASTEIIMKANANGLRIEEVPTKIVYDEDSSTHNPLSHGIDVVLSTVKHLSMRHPLLFYGVPGIMCLIIAFVFWVWTLQIFAITRQVITNIALVSIGATIVGLMLLTTAIQLWVLVSVVKEKL
jgi:glycosyltransferase involved in cell wall biosynthesis